jgi:AmmeMemoRadiSam system protein B
MRPTRPAAVAGTFYPNDAGRLAAMVDDFLAAAGREVAGRRPRALIAPHAGYVCSGATAGRAFAALAERPDGIRRVVIIGPAHYVALRGLAAPRAGAFRTPLGDVPVDRAALDAIADLPQVAEADLPHVEEHALEVELPFLQRVLDDFAIVPLVVGDAAPADVAAVLERFLDDDETLIVVSSDLSHYHDYDTAQRLDWTTAEAIERLDAKALGPREACGYLAIAGLLEVAARRRLSVMRLDLCNSGDTAGPKEPVVGYGAWAFSDPIAA